MNLTDILSVIGGAVLGAAVAYINMRISKANMNASNMAAVMGSCRVFFCLQGL